MKKYKLKKTGNLITIVILLLLVLGILSIFLWLGSKKEERIYATEDAGLTNVKGIAIVSDFISEESQRRPNIQREIKWIVLHETDNRASSASAKNHNNFLHQDESQVNSWHYTVDDSEIYHHLPDNEVGWHAGDKKTVDGGNMNGIGIEMCVNRSSDYEVTLQNTAALVAQLLVSYNLTIEDVKFHRDFSGKICPHRLYTEGRIKEFLSKIEYEIQMLGVSDDESQ